MKKQKGFTKRILRNNAYAVKLALEISKKRVLFGLIKRLIEYLLWVFYSAFFVRFILDAIEQRKPLREILSAILVIGGVSLILQLFLYYCGNVLFPVWNVKFFNNCTTGSTKRQKMWKSAVTRTGSFMIGFRRRWTIWERNCASALIT